MTNPDNQKPTEVADVEAAKTETATGTSTFSAITQRWKREDLVKKASPIMRGLSLLCSLLAFIIMVSNKHGYGRNFDEYEEYRCQFHFFQFASLLIKIKPFDTRICNWVCAIFIKNLSFFIYLFQIYIGDLDYFNIIHCVANICTFLQKGIFRSPDINFGRFLR